MSDTCPLRLLKLDAEMRDKLENKNKSKSVTLVTHDYEAGRIREINEYFEKTGILVLC